MGTEKNRADLLPGTLDMLVLKILMSGHLHGYAIAQLIQQLSGDLLRVEANTSPGSRPVTARSPARWPALWGLLSQTEKCHASGFTLEAFSTPFTVLAGPQ